MNISARSVFNLLLISLGVGFLFFSLFYVYKIAFKPEGSSKTEVVDVTPKTIDEVAEDAKTKSYEDIKANSGGAVVNPNVSDKATKEKLIEEKVINANPVNHSVVYNGQDLQPKTITIKQGDAVTFKNETPGPINVVGESGWGTAVEVPAGKAFTQGFDFKGNYKYVISPASNMSGVVVVE